MSFYEEGKAVIKTEVTSSVNAEGNEEVKTVRHFDDGTKETTIEVSYTSQGSAHDETAHSDMASNTEKGAPGFGGILFALITHVRRVTLWELAQAEPLPSEATRLDQAGVENNVLRSFLVWRHSMLLISLPPLLFSTIMAWVSLSKYELGGGFSVFGDIVWLCPYFAETILLIAIIVILCLWGRWRVTSKVLKIGWAISFVLPFIPAIVPLNLILADDIEDGSTALSVGISLAISYALQLFPVLVTFPSGLARASLRIRGLLPEGQLSSWILIITAPFQSVMYLMALILLIQISGNIALLIGTLCLLVAPWIYVFRRNVYIRVPTEENDKELRRTQFAIGCLTKLGFVCFIAWAFTGTVGEIKIVGNREEALFTFASILRVAFELIGRVLVNTAMFSDVLFRMTVTNWRQDISRRQGDNGERIDAVFDGMERSISRAEEQDDNVVLPSSSKDEHSRETSDDNESYIGGA